MRKRIRGGVAVLFLAAFVFSFAFTLTVSDADAICSPCCNIYNSQGVKVGSGSIVNYPESCAGFCGCAEGQYSFCDYICPRIR